MINPGGSGEPESVNLPEFIVSTDLDGTLLDHHTYQWSSALPALDMLKARSIPVVINTSKTFEEVRALQKQLMLTAPFIVENGSAIYLPKALYPKPKSATEHQEFWQVLLGVTRTDIIALLKKLRNEKLYKFESFFDMKIDRIIELTGLNKNDAEQAMTRQFSEPLVWYDTEDKFKAFTVQVNDAGKAILKGGRFTHILGQTDKAKAVLWLQDYLADDNDTQPKLIALGDSGNDVAMLNIADYAVAVRSPAHDFPEVHPSGELIQTHGYGPEGWAEAITHIMK